MGGCLGVDIGRREKKKNNKVKTHDLFLPLIFLLSYRSDKIKQFSEVTCATVDNDFKVVRIPAEVRLMLEKGAARFAAGSEKS